MLYFFALLLATFVHQGSLVDCPTPVGGKISTKCDVAFTMILKTLNTTILTKSTMWGFADQIGNFALTWLKARKPQVGFAVPTMCENGNVDTFLACVSKYDQKTAAKVAMDVPAVMTIIGVNQFKIDEIGQGLICALMECLKPLYTNEFVPKFKKWYPAPNKTTIQNNVCALIAENINQLPLVQKCFNAAKARTKVAVMQKLYDPYLPKYWKIYQSFRDNALVACQTKSILCGCNITVSDVVNQTSFR